MDKPEALRLADELSMSHLSYHINHAAAAELRRLYQLAMDQQGEIYALKMARSMEQKTAALKRDALLEALKEAVEVCIWPSTAFSNAFDKARAAIKAVEEGK